MGPITLFDKSFIQSLSLDESVWFDNFFVSNVCSLFFVETLADLTKENTATGKSPEDEVRIISDKFPELSGKLNALHQPICVAELLGETVSLKGQIHPPYGRYVPTSQGMAVVYEESDEERAFKRWSNREFTELEFEYARHWREFFPVLNKESSQQFFDQWRIAPPSARSPEALKLFADEVVAGKRTLLDPFHFVFPLLRVPVELHNRVISKWQTAGCPSLPEFAPYSSYIVSLQFFFHAAILTDQISLRRSNSADFAYLYYLPFCQMFVSSDNLHRKITQVLMRNDQHFIWGLDLKADLARLNEHYSKLPQETKEKGIMTFAAEPPRKGDFLVTKLWDQMLPAWRRAKVRNDPLSDDIKGLLKEIDQNRKQTSRSPVSPDSSDERVRAVSIVRRVHRKRGSWFQVPKDLPAEE